MIPIGDVIPVRVRPYVTIAAMAATLAAGGPLLHVLSSIMALGLFGRTVEDRMGHARFALFILVCAAAAVAAHALGSDEAMARGLGVGGGIAGVVAAYFVLYPYSKVLVLVPVGFPPPVVELGAIVFCAAWYMLQTISWLPSAAGSMATPVPGLVPSWAHLAGIGAGAAGVWVFRRPERLRVEWWNGPDGA